MIYKNYKVLQEINWLMKDLEARKVRKEQDVAGEQEILMALGSGFYTKTIVPNKV